MDKNLFLIAELDNNTQNRIKEYYKIILENGLIGTQTKDIPYHITLCSYSLENENNILNLMDKINGKYTEIEICFSGFGLFGLNVLYFNPAMDYKLLELYNYFKDNSYDKDNAFTAHATLLIDEPENIIKILPKITKEFVPFTGKIVNISLYEFSPKRFIKKLELK
jgi:2'-5' RNA ligase